ncbi:MAG: hypothetical protein ABSA94_07755 [Acidobacteriaceae bacterium]
MSTIATILLGKLADVGNAVGRKDPMVIPALLLEAEDCVLQMERELMASLLENKRLRCAA